MIPIFVAWRCLRLLPVAALLVSLISLPVQAQDRSAEVKKIVEEALASMVPGSLTLIEVRWVGPISVKPEGERYAVGLPTLRVTGPGGEKLEVKGGTLDMAAAGADRWRIHYRVPSPIAVMGSNGRPFGEISFERQRFTGLWIKNLKSFVEAEAELANLAFTDANGARPFTLERVSSQRKYAETTPGKWSGTDATNIEKVAVNDVAGISVRLEKAVLDGSVTGFDIAQAARFAEQARLATAEPAPKKKGQPQKPKRDVKAIRQTLRTIPIPLAAGSATFRFENIATKGPEGGFAMEQAVYGTSFEGLDRDRSTARLTYSHKGATLVPQPSPDFTPKTAEFSLRVGSLPSKELWQALLAFIGDAAERDVEAAAETLAFKLPGMFSDAGVEIGLDRLKTDMSEAAVDMSGVAVFEANAAFGVVAGFNLALTDLDTVMKMLKDGDEDIAKIALPVLTIVQALGQNAEPDRGRSVKRYRFEVSADGQTLLNGNDMSHLLGGFAGGEKEPKPAPKRSRRN